MAGAGQWTHLLKEHRVAFLEEEGMDAGFSGQKVSTTPYSRGPEAWRGYKYFPRATELGSGQIDPSLSGSKVCVLFVTKPGQSGSLQTPQSWWGWENHCLLNKSDQHLSGASSRTLRSGGASKRALPSWLWSCPRCPGQ